MGLGARLGHRPRGRLASASIQASRLIVYTRQRRVAFMGTKSGSATTTSCRNSSSTWAGPVALMPAGSVPLKTFYSCFSKHGQHPS